MPNPNFKFLLFLMSLFLITLKVSVAQTPDMIGEVSSETLEPKTRINFQWSTYDADGDPVTSDILLSNMSDYSVILLNKTKLNGTSYLQSSDEALSNGLYFLKIRNCDPYDCSNWSESRQFTINILIPDEIKLQAVKKGKYLGGFVSYLTDDPFKSKIKIVIEVIDERLFALQKRLNYTSGLDTLEDLKFVYDLNRTKIVQFNKLSGGYEFETEISMRGNVFLYPFDSYNSKILISPKRLKDSVITENYNQDFVLVSEFKKGEINLIKNRKPLAFLKYSSGLIIFLIYLFKFKKYATHNKTNLRATRTFLTQFSILLGVLSFSFFFSFGNVNYIISVGSLPFLVMFSFAAFYYVVNIRRWTSKVKGSL